jgi:hypothetical protein
VVSVLGIHAALSFARPKLALHLPWGWNLGEIGPREMGNADVYPPDSELHNAQVERSANRSSSFGIGCCHTTTRSRAKPATPACR